MHAFNTCTQKAEVGAGDGQCEPSWNVSPRGIDGKPKPPEKAYESQ